MDTPILLTSEMIIARNKEIFKEETGEMREALLLINQYALDLLAEGKMLTTDTDGNIRLWEGERQ